MINLYVTNIAELLDDSIFQRAFACVDEERQQKIISYKKTKDRARSLAAGLLLKYALKENGKDNLALITNAHGKMMADPKEHFYFSLSHSGDYAACAVSDENIGMDLQEIKSLKENLAKRFFHPQEVEYLQTVMEKEGSVAYEQIFFSLWCLKESYLKYTGLGFAAGMRNDNFLPFLDTSAEVIDKAIITTRGHVIFGENLTILNGYAMAIISSKEELIQKTNWVQIATLI